MPPCQKGRPRIKPLPQDMDSNRPKNINEQVEAQASTVDSFFVATPPIADPNLVEAVAILARVIPTLMTLAEKGIVDYCKDLKNMGCKIFTGFLESDLACSCLQKLRLFPLLLRFLSP